MKVDYEVKSVAQSTGSMDTIFEDQIMCPVCSSTAFAVFVHMTDYIDLVCQSCHSLIHVLSIEGK